MPPVSETDLRSQSQCVGVHLGTKNYKAKSNLFYFVIYITIFQLGSWQADRVNLSWQRFWASEPYLISVYLYLPNVMATYLSQWLLPLLKYHPLLAATEEIIFTSLLLPLRFADEVAQIPHSDKCASRHCFPLGIA